MLTERNSCSVIRLSPLPLGRGSYSIPFYGDNNKMGENELKKLLSSQGKLPREIQDEAEILFDLGWDIPKIERMIYFKTRRI
jgi:hypothetical protein